MLSPDAADLVADAHERELGDVGCAARAVRFAEVIARRQGLTRTAAHLQEVIWARPSLCCDRRVDDRENVVELHLLDVLRRIDAEARDTQARQHDQVAGDLLSYRWQPGVQVRQPEQLAVLDVRGVLVIADRARRMEVTRRVETGIAVLGVRRPVAADPGTRIVGHVVDDGIHVDAYAHGVTALHHGGEFGVRSRPTARDAVAHRLVALAPGVARGLDPVLLWRG